MPPADSSEITNYKGGDNVQLYSITDRGKLRENNEDYCMTKEIGNYTLLILADGMGGHKGGETASRKAIEEISAILERDLTEKMLPGQIMLLLSEALESANKEIISLSRSNSKLVGMGTTCDVCVISKNTAYIAHIGDSRVYKIAKKGGSIRKLTKDHSLVEYMLETGAITPEEAMNHPQKNVILRALGTTENIEVDILHEKLSSGDVLLMCSDGLTNMLDEGVIAQTVSAENTPEDCAARLVQLANEAGGADNITVVIARY